MAARKTGRKDPAKVDMRDVVREQCAVAVSFAEDGAYHAAASVLRVLALRISAHARVKNEESDAAIEGLTP